MPSDYRMSINGRKYKKSDNRYKKLIYLFERHRKKNYSNLKFRQENRILLKRILIHHNRFLHNSYLNPNENIYSYDPENRSKYLNLILSEKFKYKSYPRKNYQQDSTQVLSFCH